MYNVSVMKRQRPIKNCYRVIENKFLAGEYPWDLNNEFAVKKITPLLKAGVTCFIDLTHPDDGMKPYRHLVNRLSSHQTQIFRFPIIDYSVPESKGFTISILNQSDAVIYESAMAYLHYRGGIGRTWTIAGCWLSRHGYKGEDALRKLRHLWQECPKSAFRKSPESAEQEEYIINWDEDL